MKKGEKPKNIKLHNTHTVLDLVRKGEMATVAEVSAAVKLSKTTVKKIFDGLVEEGLVFPAGKGDSTDEGGKKPELYRFNAKYGYVAAIHITPDEVISVTTDMRGDIDHKEKYTLPRNAALQEVMPLLAEAVRSSMRLKEGTGSILVAVVVALPGLAASSEGVSIYSPHYPSWGRHVPFESMLRRHLGPGWNTPILIDDVNRYQAIAEREKGVAGGARSYIVIDALDEGVGAGIVLNGALFAGSQSLSGEIGHMTVNPVNGPPCICGSAGCLEAMVSAKRILGLAASAKAGGRHSSLFVGDGDRPVGLDDICLGAESGDKLCRELISDVARWFLVGFGNIIMTLDPELIVLQGKYVKAGAYFLNLLREGISRIGLPLVEKRVRVEYSVMGEDRGVIGGAATALSDFFELRRSE